MLHRCVVSGGSNYFRDFMDFRDFSQKIAHLAISINVKLLKLLTYNRNVGILLIMRGQASFIRPAVLEISISAHSFL